MSGIPAAWSDPQRRSRQRSTGVESKHPIGFTATRPFGLARIARRTARPAADRDSIAQDAPAAYDRGVSNDQVFRAAATERLRLADLLEGLSPDQLATPSLCGDWDVQTVGAHLASAITTKLPTFMVAVARQAAQRPISETIAIIRANADSRFAPPVTGPRAPLTDVLVHTGDVARPLGLPHDAAADHLRMALQFLTGGRPIAFVKRGSLNDLHLVADDVDIDVGSGEEVRGRGIDLMMAMCGRTTALDDLQGAGVATLRGRLSQ
jgi:uncharacterized protein (TIGR03083 family)